MSSSSSLASVSPRLRNSDGLLAADRHDGDDRDVLLERERGSSPCGRRSRPGCAPTPGGGPRSRRRGRRAPRRRPRAPCRALLVRGARRRRTSAGSPGPGMETHEVVGERVERALDAEVRAEGEREDAAVDGEVAAGVVADEQDRAVLGDVAQAADLAAEVQARQQPQPRAGARGCSPGRGRRGSAVGMRSRDLPAGDAAARRSGRPEPPSPSVRRRRRRRRRQCAFARPLPGPRCARSVDARVVVPAIGRNVPVALGRRGDARRRALAQGASTRPKKRSSSAVDLARRARSAARGRSSRGRSARPAAASARRGA